MFRADSTAEEAGWANDAYRGGVGYRGCRAYSYGGELRLRTANTLDCIFGVS